MISVPDESRIFELGARRTFFEYRDDLLTGEYTTSPSDARWKLLRTATGWELRTPETVGTYDEEGRLLARTDRHGNAATAFYGYPGSCADLGPLVQVAFADVRRADFSYHPDIKLAAITEVGVDRALAAPGSTSGASPGISSSRPGPT